MFCKTLHTLLHIRHRNLTWYMMKKKGRERTWQQWEEDGETLLATELFWMSWANMVVASQCVLQLCRTASFAAMPICVLKTRPIYTYLSTDYTSSQQNKWMQSRWDTLSSGMNYPWSKNGFIVIHPPYSPFLNPTEEVFQHGCGRFTVSGLMSGYPWFKPWRRPATKSRQGLFKNGFAIQEDSFLTVLCYMARSS